MTRPRKDGKCKNGHPLEGDNLGLTKGGTARFCWICRRAALALARKSRPIALVRASRPPRRLPIQVAMTPAQLASARAEFEAWLARDMHSTKYRRAS